MNTNNYIMTKREKLDYLFNKVDSAVVNAAEWDKWITIKFKLDGDYFRSSFNLNEADECKSAIESWVDKGAIQISITTTEDRYF